MKWSTKNRYEANKCSHRQWIENETIIYPHFASLITNDVPLSLFPPTLFSVSIFHSLFSSLLPLTLLSMTYCRQLILESYTEHVGDYVMIREWKPWNLSANLVMFISSTLNVTWVNIEISFVVIATIQQFTSSVFSTLFFTISRLVIEWVFAAVGINWLQSA